MTMPCPAREEFQIGWICALPIEAAAAKEMLDEDFGILEEQDVADTNSYRLGKIGKHYVVIACLPAGQYGACAATTVASNMVRTFSKSLRIGLMVGVGGGIPSTDHDIRLGDIVISCPTGTCGGVIQYDMGKVTADGVFCRTGSLNSPPRSLLTAVNHMRAAELTDDPCYLEYLQRAIRRTRRTQAHFGRPSSQSDRLFKTKHEHPATAKNCDMCPTEWEETRSERDSQDPLPHYGIIASGNSVIKHGGTREQLRLESGVLCFEMEAAGLMLDFPCIVIRGICDYSDSHKNKQWQGYAALAAASYTKELLGYMPCGRVSQENLAVDVCTDPGCGKSVLAKSLIDDDLGASSSTVSICYFFFKDNGDQNNLATALCAILHQLFSQQPNLLRHALPSWERNGNKLQQEAAELWRIFIAATSDPASANTICVLDALDECHPDDQSRLIHRLEDFCHRTDSSPLETWLKFLITSRPYDEVKDQFKAITDSFPQIHLKGEEENDQIREEVNLVVRIRVKELAETASLSSDVQQRLEHQLLQMNTAHTFYDAPHMNPIHLAAFNGHKRMVLKLLAENGSSIYEGDNTGSNALMWASLNGHEEVAELLLDRGADANVQGGQCGSALQAASLGGHDKIVQMLLEEGADTNAQGGLYGNALQAASIGGHENVIQVLLEEGVDANAQGGFYGNALQAASIGGHNKIIQVLLEEGADANAQGGIYGHALQAASMGGHEKVVQVLLDHGADVNAQGGVHGNALQAASTGGHENVVQVLLDHRADPNAQGGLFDNALQAASAKGYEKVVQMLLNHGADANARGGFFGNALHAASRNGHERVVQMLLDHRADANAQGGGYGNALQAASSEDMTRL
ncbi:hypothetical protein CNMCM5878_005755 [Aspergillus fumigatiaffinis]|nr:hypothetical protein CNMCM5878_005755 [Aspergillus fumigatiaffinis]